MGGGDSQWIVRLPGRRLLFLIFVAKNVSRKSEAVGAAKWLVNGDRRLFSLVDAGKLFHQAISNLSRFILNSGQNV